jgi:hypothetical protein
MVASGCEALRIAWGSARRCVGGCGAFAPAVASAPLKHCSPTPFSARDIDPASED